jgi:hypothetical protein
MAGRPWPGRHICVHLQGLSLEIINGSVILACDVKDHKPI